MKVATLGVQKQITIRENNTKLIVWNSRSKDAHNNTWKVKQYIKPNHLAPTKHPTMISELLKKSYYSSQTKYPKKWQRNTIMPNDSSIILKARLQKHLLNCSWSTPIISESTKPKLETTKILSYSKCLEDNSKHPNLNPMIPWGENFIYKRLNLFI